MIPVYRQAGDVVAHGIHKGIAFQVIVGNDIHGTGIFGEARTYKTLITQSIMNGKREYACHVIKPLLMKSRLTWKRIKEAVESWQECIENTLADDCSEAT